MDKNNPSPAIDPVDLLNEHYEALEMRDDFRRDLLAKTRGVVAARRRRLVFRWAASLAGVAAGAAILVLSWHFFFSTPEGTRTVLTPRGSARAAKVTAPVEKPDSSTSAAPRTRSPVPNIQEVVKTPQPDKIPSRQAPETPQPAGPALVAVISVQQPVTDGSGKALNPGDRLAVGDTIRTGRGGRVTLVTRKGSELHLDSNTQLALSDRAIAAISCGRLYCSNRDEEIARIDTPAGHVRLLGTVVDTAVVRKDTVAVTVVEGKVQLSNRHGNAVVDAGKRSVLVAYRPPQAGVRVNTYRETAWYHGRWDVQSDYGDLAYTVRRGDGLITEVWTKRPDGSGKRRLRSYLGEIELGAWVPGERWINIDDIGLASNFRRPLLRPAVMSSYGYNQIVERRNCLLDAATGQSSTFSKLPSRYYSAWAYDSTSPDTTRTAFLQWHDENHPDQHEMDLYVYDRTTGDVTQLFTGKIRIVPAWAPDNRHIAVTVGEENSLDYNIAILDSFTGRIDTRIVGAGARFSPNGKKIAYCADFKKYGYYWSNVPSSGSIFVLDLSAGAEPVRVSPEADWDKQEWAVDPQWSPDSTRILYRASNCRLCVVRDDGTGRTDIYSSSNGFATRRASWAPSGDAVYVIVEEYPVSVFHTLLVAADGSSVTEVLNGSAEDSKLPRNAKVQTDGAVSAVQEASRRFKVGRVCLLQARLPEAREWFRSSADMMAQLVWAYPLSGLGTEDTLRYADAAARMADMADDGLLAECCRMRTFDLRWALHWSVVESNRRGARQFPPDAVALEELLRVSAWDTEYLPAEEFLRCPGRSDHEPSPYAYSPPPPGELPRVGDTILSCPLHPSSCLLWQEWMNRNMNQVLMPQGKTGERCAIQETPYVFQNVGADPLTVIHHKFTDKYEVQGTAKLLPTGRVYTNEEISLPADEASIARDIDAAGALDWGDLPESGGWSGRELKFCRAVAQYEAGLPVTDWETIDGEPAILLFTGSHSGCRARHSDAVVQWVGPGDAKIYQLEPSGRLRVYGVVRVAQTGQICKNGWIDKDGKVLSTEK